MWEQLFHQNHQYYHFPSNHACEWGSLNSKMQNHNVAVKYICRATIPSNLLLDSI